jgi:hypothetical protein
VDDSLNEAARRQLPDPASAPSVLAKRQPAGDREEPSAPAPRQELTKSTRSRSFRVPVALAGIAALVVIALLLAGPRSESPRGGPGTANREPVTLHWPAVRGADLYDVILWRGSKRVGDHWPKTAQLTLPVGLPSGTYRWFVYPAESRGGKYQFGRLLRTGVVKI